ncbi:MAG: hypothetical protein KF869_08315 [Phycisphaeraceae bacterium]|nr:hypothetical protein [Phycisphaeraceae bacterium]
MTIRTMDDLNLHDSLLVGATITSNDGVVVIALQLQYKESYEHEGFVPAKLSFHDCVAMEATFRFWISTHEAVMGSETLVPDAAQKFIRLMRPLGDIPGDVAVHRLETATTASTMTIACRGVELIFEVPGNEVVQD